MGRLLLMLFACVAACIMMIAMPLLYFTPVSGAPVPEIQPDVQYVRGSDSGPADVPMPERAPIAPEAQPMPTSDGTDLMAFIPIVLLLTVVFMFGYGIYDMFRLYLQYRRTKEADEVLFP